MLKYKNIIVILVLVIGSLGTFYLQSAFAKDNLPRYSFKKIEGNEKEIKDVRLLASSDNHGKFFESLIITPNKTTYGSEINFIQSFFGNGFYLPEKITTLQKEYRSFMRGKENPNAFYEDQNKLAYVDLTESGSVGAKIFTFKLDILDKKKADRETIKVEVPKSREYEFLDTQDIQIVGDELKIVTLNYKNGTEGIHAYSIDLPSKRLVGDDLIVSNKQAQNGEGLHFTRYNETNTMMENKYLLYNLGEYKLVEQADGGMIEEEINSETVLYDLEKNKKQTIKFPKEIVEAKLANPHHYYDEKNIYIVGQTPEGFKVFIYDFQSNKLVKKWNYSIHLDDVNSIQMTINKERLFIAVDRVKAEGEEEPPVEVIVVDLQNGQFLYKGELVGSKKIEGSLNIDGMEIN